MGSFEQQKVEWLRLQGVLQGVFMTGPVSWYVNSDILNSPNVVSKVLEFTYQLTLKRPVKKHPCIRLRWKG